jgi:hypothetical protein
MLPHLRCLLLYHSPINRAKCHLIPPSFLMTSLWETPHLCVDGKKARHLKKPIPPPTFPFLARLDNANGDKNCVPLHLQHPACATENDHRLHGFFFAVAFSSHTLASLHTHLSNLSHHQSHTKPPMTTLFPSTSVTSHVALTMNFLISILLTNNSVTRCNIPHIESIRESTYLLLKQNS